MQKYLKLCQKLRSMPKVWENVLIAIFTVQMIFLVYRTIFLVCRKFFFARAVQTFFASSLPYGLMCVKASLWTACCGQKSCQHIDEIDPNSKLLKSNYLSSMLSTQCAAVMKCLWLTRDVPHWCCHSPSDLKPISSTLYEWIFA